MTQRVEYKKHYKMRTLLIVEARRQHTLKGYRFYVHRVPASFRPDQSERQDQRGNTNVSENDCLHKSCLPVDLPSGPPDTMTRYT